VELGGLGAVPAEALGLSFLLVLLHEAVLARALRAGVAAG
jgi:hypothetical protein